MWIKTDIAFEIAEKVRMLVSLFFMHSIYITDVNTHYWIALIGSPTIQNQLSFF